MHKQTISLADTQQFSSFFLDYLAEKESLRLFYNHFPTLENLEKSSKERVFDSNKREILRDVLQEQYASYPTGLAKHQIDSLLQPNTFTVTTGHQLNIFSGPLYVIYKMVTTIRLAQQLKEKYPHCHFVPVYWMATEDHDFEEINHFHLFNKKYIWQTDQTGAVGRLHPEGIQAIFAQISDKLPIFEKAYLEHATLADATRYWAHALFENQGLICLDADHPRLKKQFISVIKADIFDHTTQTIVSQTSEKLGKAGYKTQVNAREINFFYLDGNLRERVTENPQGGYQVLNTSLSFTKEALEQEIETHPEKFSPNVLLRPVYQETILPNLAYIGGPAEVVYWLQLKELFEALHTPFPVVMPRNFALLINHNTQKRLEKTGLRPEELFVDEAALKRAYIEKNVADPVSLEAEKKVMEQAFETMLQKALILDKSLEGFVGAERKKVQISLETVEKRLKKAEEQKQETGIQQLLTLRSRLFPEGGLQERSDNFLNFYLNNPQLIEQLLAGFDPLDFRFYMFTES